MQRVDQVLERIRELPLSPVVARILQAVRDEKAGTREIAKIISQDQAFTARLLRIANSPYYGQYRPVTTLSQAVPILGISTITSLALALFSFGYFQSQDDGRLSMKQLWMHCLKCAFWSKQIALRIGHASAEEAFIAGLLHDMGKAVFYRFFEKDLLEAFEIAQTRDIDLSEAERIILGIDHAAAGEIMAQKWSLPPILQYSIGYHHRPSSLPESVEDAVRKTVSVVHLSDYLSELFPVEPHPGSRCEKIEEGVWSLLDLDQESCQELYEVVSGEMEESLAFFEPLHTSSRTGTKNLSHKNGTRSAKPNPSSSVRLEPQQRAAPVARSSEETMEKFSRFTEAGNQIALLAGLDDLLPNIASQAIALLKADAVEVLVPNEQGLKVAGAAGDSYLLGKIIPCGNSLAGWVAKMGESIMISDIAKAPPSLEKSIFERAGFKSHLLLPVEWAGKQMAVLSFHNRKEQEWSSQEVALFSPFLGLVGVALENARLYQKASSEAAELERLNVELSRALSLRTKFLATVSHELRTPLSVIMGYSQLVLESHYGEPGDGIRDALGRISNEAKVQMRLITTLLDIAQLETGTFPMHYEATDLIALLDEVFEHAAALLKEKPTVLERDCDRNLPLIFTDKSRLKQILGQLLDNAAKFTQEGKIILRASARDDGVEIAVEDTGIGIDPDNLTVIFEGFRQVEEADNRCFGGLGSGLYLVRRLLEILGGRISVESRLGEGSTFRVWLPMRARDCPAPGTQA